MWNQLSLDLTFKSFASVLSFPGARSFLNFVPCLLPIANPLTIISITKPNFMRNQSCSPNAPLVIAIIATPERINKIIPIPKNFGNCAMALLIAIAFGLSFAYCFQNCLVVTKSANVIPAIMVNPIICVTRAR